MSQGLQGFRGKLYLKKGEAGSYAKIAELQDVTLRITADQIEASSHDTEGWKDYLPGLKEWTASASFVFVSDDVAQEDLYDVLVGHQVVTLKLESDTNPGAVQYEGNAVVTSYEHSLPNSDIQALSVEFQGAGPLTRGTVFEE